MSSSSDENEERWVGLTADAIASLQEELASSEKDLGSSQRPEASSLLSSSAVLLTGATTFVGAHLLAELLSQQVVGGSKVVCIVPVASPAVAEKRVKNALLRFGLWDRIAAIAPVDGASSEHERQPANAFESSVVCLNVDLSLVDLGLEQSELSHFVRTVGLGCRVVNCGMYEVTNDASSAVQRELIIGRTARLLKIAAELQCSAFLHISSLQVLPSQATSVRQAQDAAKHPFAVLHDDADRARLAAEAVVDSAAQKLPNVVIARLGAVCAPAAPGLSSNALSADVAAALAQSSWQTSFLTACLEVGAAPPPSSVASAPWELNFAYVDTTAQLLVRALQMETRSNDSLSPHAPAPLLEGGAKVLHLANGKKAGYAKVLTELQKAAPGLKIAASFAEFKDLLAAGAHNVQQGFAARLLPLLAPSSSLAEAAAAINHTPAASCERSLAYLNRDFVAPIHRAHQINYCDPVSLFRPGQSMSALLIAASDPRGRPIPVRGRVVLISGASSGIGLGVGKYLAKKGARVAFCARRIERINSELEAFQVAHPEAKGSVMGVQLDVTSRESFKKAVSVVEETLGPVDVLYNNAGIMPYNFMANLHEDEWSQSVDVNCKGVLHGIGAVLPGMMARKRGHIVNTSSDAGRKVFPGLAVYSATKYFVEAVSRGLRAEMAAKELPIKVTTVQPGDVLTDLNKTTTDMEAMKECGSYLSEPGVEILQVQDIARAVEFAITQPAAAAVNEVLIEPTTFPI